MLLPATPPTALSSAAAGRQATDPGRSTVLVVGAGPTGLILAAVLARYGISVRIVDSGPGPSQHTKATNLMQRSQELVAALGLQQELAGLSGAMRRLMVSAYGADLGPRTMHLPERSPYPDVLLCGQDRFEGVLTRELGRLGVRIECGTALTGLRQTPDGVTATLVRDGVEERSLSRGPSAVTARPGSPGHSRTWLSPRSGPV